MAARLFPPLSRDGDDTKHDNPDVSHLRVLTLLACRAELIIANLLCASSDTSHQTFQLHTHPDRADVLFDFGYFKRPEAFDATIHTSDSLTRVDRTCKAACASNVAKIYNKFADVVRFQTDFADFANALDDDAARSGGFRENTRHGYGYETLETSDDDTDTAGGGRDGLSETSSGDDYSDGASSRDLTLNDSSEKRRSNRPTSDASAAIYGPRGQYPALITELLLETIANFSYMLLIVHRRFAVTFRERVIVAHHRWRAGDCEANGTRVVATLNRVIELCGRDASSPDAPANQNTQNTEYPAHVFHHFTLPKQVVRFVLRRYRKRRGSDIGRGEGKQRSMDDDDESAESPDCVAGSIARNVSLALFFAPDLLQNDHHLMRDIVDLYFPESFVVSMGGGSVLDLSKGWWNFPAARRALINASWCVEALEEEEDASSDEEVRDDEVRDGFFANHSRRHAAARAVKQRHRRLRALAEDVAETLDRVTAAKMDDDAASRVACDFEPLLRLITAVNADVNWCLTHARGSDSRFRKLFAQHAPCPEFVMDVALDVALLEQVLDSAVKNAERTKENRWCYAKKTAVFNAKALAECFFGEDTTAHARVEEDTAGEMTPRPTPFATPTKRDVTPQTPKTPNRATRRARYDRVASRLERLHGSLTNENATQCATEVASLARALQRAEEEQAERTRRREHSSADATFDALRHRARAHASVLRESLETMHRASTLDEGNARRLCVASDFSLAFCLLETHDVSYLKSLLVDDPERFTPRFHAFLAKCASTVETKLIRFDIPGDGGEPISQWRRVANYHANEVVSFAARVVASVPERAFAILEEALFGETEKAHDDTQPLHDTPSRLRVEEASSAVSTLFESVLVTPPIRIGVQILTPAHLLKIALRRSLREKLRDAFHETCRFTKKETSSVFAVSVTTRDCTLGEFTDQLRLLKQRIETVDEVFRFLTRNFSSLGSAANATAEETTSLFLEFVAIERDVFFTTHGLVHVGVESSQRTTQEHPGVSLRNKLGRLFLGDLGNKDLFDENNSSSIPASHSNSPARPTCFGRLLHALLRLTDPSVAKFVDHAVGWVGAVGQARTSREARGTTPGTCETSQVLFTALGPSGVNLLRVLLNDMAIHTLSVLMRTVLLFLEDTSPEGDSLRAALDAAGVTSSGEGVALDSDLLGGFFDELRRGCLRTGHLVLVETNLAVTYERNSRTCGRSVHHAVEAVSLGAAGETGCFPFVFAGTKNGKRKKADERNTHSLVAFALYLFTLSEVGKYHHESELGGASLVPKNARVTCDVTPLVMGVRELLRCAEKDDETTTKKSSKTKAPGPVTSRYLELLTRHLNSLCVLRSHGSYEEPLNKFEDVVSTVMETAQRLAVLSPSTFDFANPNHASGGGENGVASKTLAAWLEAFCALANISRETLYRHAPAHVMDNAFHTGGF